MGAIEWEIPDPGKTYFLKLAAECVREVNKQQDSEGISYSRKAMIITGMVFNTTGRWEESQLTVVLHNIIKKHYEEFKNASLDAVEVVR